MTVCVPKRPFSITWKVFKYTFYISFITIFISELVSVSQTNWKIIDDYTGLALGYGAVGSAVILYFLTIDLYELNKKKKWVKWCK